MTNAWAEIWKQYPNKLGKKRAESAFRRSVKTQADLRDVQIALDAYIAFKRHPKNVWMSWQHGSTWFGNWRDWLPEERAELLIDEKPEGHAHWCPECRPSHEWNCDADECRKPLAYPCAGYEARIRELIMAVKA